MWLRTLLHLLCCMNVATLIPDHLWMSESQNMSPYILGAFTSVLGSVHLWLDRPRWTLLPGRTRSLQEKQLLANCTVSSQKRTIYSSWQISFSSSSSMARIDLHYYNLMISVESLDGWLHRLHALQVQGKSTHEFSSLCPQKQTSDKLLLIVQVLKCPTLNRMWGQLNNWHRLNLLNLSSKCF